MTTFTPELLAIGRTLRALRRAQGLTQAQLAKRLGCHRISIVHLERGRGTSLALAAAAAHELGAQLLVVSPQVVP